MRRVRMASVAAFVLMLAACASTEPRRGLRADRQDDYDAVKVATVTQWAQARGATVVWINYPRKRSDDDGG